MLSTFAASGVSIFGEAIGDRYRWRTLSRIPARTRKGSCSSAAIEVSPARRFSAPYHLVGPRSVSQYRLYVPASYSDSSDAYNIDETQAK